MQRGTYPKLFINPMSINVIFSVVDFVRMNNIKDIGFAVTRHQIDYDGGYVSLLNTFSFAYYVKKAVPEMMISRDHGCSGPFCHYSLMKDEEAGINILHIDPWANNTIEDVIDITSEAILMYGKSLFEIGTEQKVKEYDAETFEYFLSKVKEKTGKCFDRVVYGVIQGKTKVFNSENKLDFNDVEFEKMIKICKKFDILSKEHNSDFLGDGIKKRMEKGLDCCNVGPEIIREQNKFYEEELIRQKRVQDLETVFNICHEDGQWKRWTDKESHIIETTLHYHYKNPVINEIIFSLEMDEPEGWKPITERISKIYEGVK